MTTLNVWTFTKCLGFSPTSHRLRLLSTTFVNHLDQRWREKEGLPKNPNASGVLTDAPDYTFMDGRPTPYGVRQKKRIMKGKEVAEQIICLSKEVDFALERHRQLQVQGEEKRKEILSNKLKPKGQLLLARKKDKKL